MRNDRGRRGTATAGVALLALALSAAAHAETVAEWTEDLTQQIGQQLNCTVSLVSQVVERRVAGEQLIMAKVHCKDGRTYDAFRPDELSDFSFKRCETSRSERSC